jgi:hypothetical protein
MGAGPDLRDSSTAVIAPKPNVYKCTMRELHRLWEGSRLVDKVGIPTEAHRPFKCQIDAHSANHHVLILHFNVSGARTH